LFFSIVVMETTAGFTCVTRDVKSGNGWGATLVPGGFTGVPAFAALPDGLVLFGTSAWPTAKPPSVVPTSRAAASPARRQGRAVACESV
jgi:hypothetical protein